MIKTFFAGILLVFSSLTADSQVLMALIFGDKLNGDGIEFGLDFGLNNSTLSGFSSPENMTNWNLGFSFDIRVKNQWSISTGTRVKNTMEVGGLSLDELSGLGYSFLTQHEADDYSQRLAQIQVPVLIRRRTASRLYFELGGSGALNMTSVVAKHYEEDGRDIQESLNNVDDIRRIEFGVSGGIGYDFSEGKGLVGGVRYYQSLTNLYIDYEGYSWSMFDVYIQVPIGIKAPKSSESSDE